MLKFIKVCLLKFGVSFFDLSTEILFDFTPSHMKMLVSDLRCIIQRYDKSIVKKEDQYLVHN